MKRFVWVTGLAGLLILPQTSQAIPIQDTPSRPLTYLNSTSPEELALNRLAESAAPPATAVVAVRQAVAVAPTAGSLRQAAPTAPAVAGVRTAPQVAPVAPLLSALTSRPEATRSAVIVSRNGYTPEPLVGNNDRTPVTTSTPPRPGSDPAAVPDGGATAGLLGIGLLGTAVMRRKLIG